MEIITFVLTILAGTALAWGETNPRGGPEPLVGLHNPHKLFRPHTSDSGALIIDLPPFTAPLPTPSVSRPTTDAASKSTTQVAASSTSSAPEPTTTTNAGQLIIDLPATTMRLPWANLPVPNPHSTPNNFLKTFRPHHFGMFPHGGMYPNRPIRRRSFMEPTPATLITSSTSLAPSQPFESSASSTSSDQPVLSSDQPNLSNSDQRPINLTKIIELATKVGILNGTSVVEKNMTESDLDKPEVIELIRNPDVQRLVMEEPPQEIVAGRKRPIGNWFRAMSGTIKGMFKWIGGLFGSRKGRAAGTAGAMGAVAAAAVGNADHRGKPQVHHQYSDGIKIGTMGAAGAAGAPFINWWLMNKDKNKKDKNESNEKSRVAAEPPSQEIPVVSASTYAPQSSAATSVETNSATSTAATANTNYWSAGPGHGYRPHYVVHPPNKRSDTDPSSKEALPIKFDAFFEAIRKMFEENKRRNETDVPQTARVVRLRRGRARLIENHRTRSMVSAM